MFSINPRNQPDEPKDRKSFKSDDYVDDEVASTPADKEHEHKGGLFARLFVRAFVAILIS